MLITVGLKGLKGVTVHMATRQDFLKVLSRGLCIWL